MSVRAGDVTQAFDDDDVGWLERSGSVDVDAREAVRGSRHREVKLPRPLGHPMHRACGRMAEDRTLSTREERSLIWQVRAPKSEVRPPRRRQNGPVCNP
jgi:hypothetical protein